MTTDPPTPDRLSAELEQFLLWTLECLNLSVEPDQADGFKLILDEQDRAAFSGAEQIAFTFRSMTDPSEGTVECISLASPLWRWAMTRLRDGGKVLQTAPRLQPAGVHSFAQRLFDRYTIDNGSVRLGGCTLEDEPLVRMTFAENTPDGPMLKHVFADAQGLPLDSHLSAALQLTELEPAHGRPRPLPPETIRRWQDSARQLAPPSLQASPPELQGMAVVWCKYARGKLLFAVGDNQTELAFEGWAKLLADGLTDPPPFPCRATGRSSYHLAATDDGQITTRESIATCDESGKRVLATDLETCAVSGRRVRRKYLRDCPVTGVRLLPSQSIACNVCCQDVNPQCLVQGRCKACRDLHPVGKDDALVARILADYPQLSGWGGWRISESARVHILTATSLLRRLLLVLDKETFEPIRLADGSRLARRWTDVPPEQRKDLLGE